MNMAISRLVAGGVTGVAIAAACLLNNGPTAEADPVPSTPERAYALVGSWHLQNVLNALVNPSGDIASWDSFPPRVVRPKIGGAAFPAPEFTADGTRTLSATWNSANDVYLDNMGLSVDLHNAGLDDDGVNEVDVARTYAPPASGVIVPAGSAGDKLTWIPLGREAISVAVQEGGGSGALPVPITAFTGPELAFLYSATSSGTLASSSLPGCVWTAGLGSADPALNCGGITETIHPTLPQDPEVRGFFLAATGVSSFSIGSWVDQASAPHADEASQLTVTGQIMPHSVSSWIAQRNGLTTDKTAGISLTSVNGYAPVTLVAGGWLAPGALYGSSSVVGSSGLGFFARDTFLVVDTANAPSGLVAEVHVLGTTAGNRTVLSHYGFLPLSYVGSSGIAHTNYTN